MCIRNIIHQSQKGLSKIKCGRIPDIPFPVKRLNVKCKNDFKVKSLDFFGVGYFRYQNTCMYCTSQFKAANCVSIFLLL